ncbi:hypothetical protein CLIB1423_07S01772 [[Candida] railenensis]|uniref:CID domain-containing protein n=1 Tax=[Candida] railenensis TaxID=45579 RepID=A0A9P0VY47_9ASCO|nr:hypothetical protein CLIB1423_07S01772 [[Candida] railenensis]
MDSFETSTQFSQILRTLTPSMQSLIRGAHFALKYYQSEDYLVHTIVEVVDDPKVDLNTKSTIFQFIEVLVHESYTVSEQPKSVYNYPYVTALKSLLPKVLLQTLPGSNCSSLYNVYCNLKSISKTLKFNFEEYDIRFNSINESFTLEDEENIIANVEFPQVNEDDEVETQEPLITTWNLLIKKKKQSQYERLRLLRHKELCSGKLIEEDEMFNIRLGEKSQGGVQKKEADPQLLTKRQILARMEDDRESHKRSKEHLWMVSRPRDVNGVTEDEFLTSYWNKYKVMNEDEEKTLFADLEELNQLVAMSYKDKQF